MSIEQTITEMARAAKEAAKTVARLGTQEKDQALEQIAKKLLDEAATIKGENEKDLKKAREKGLSEAMIDRLTVSDAVIESMAQGLRDVVKLPDPVGREAHAPVVRDGRREAAELEPEAGHDRHRAQARDRVVGADQVERGHAFEQDECGFQRTVTSCRGATDGWADAACMHPP